MKIAAAVVLASLAGAAAKCPGSASFVHASCQVEVDVQASCDDVRAEMLARVGGQSTGKWYDPHNKGTYSVLESAGSLTLQRVTRDKKYTDKIGFDFKATAASTCVVSGCSESQVFSVADFSTNYCNMRMMYCGSAEGCKPVLHDFGVTESSVSPSFGASHDPSACLKVVARPLEFLN